ncbi:amidohydrolase family protein [Pseudoxanthomonas sp. J35]|uniref:amidohydrolase family protein n=1 Tax=Pseudoxanthomonas sp. J35 TaxID=935852 RepID=UPI0004B319E8|nr:amidohydrolase family protein [Pseudoxanthomonas sp. J35]
MLLGALACAAPAGATDLAIVGARIIPAPDAAPIGNGVILVDDGRIEAVGSAGEVAVPDGVPRLEVDGQVIVAGFWNSHMHLLGEAYKDVARQPAGRLAAVLQEQYGHWGFTTVFDLASFGGDAPALKRRIEAGEVRGPRVLSVGMPFFPLDGTPVYTRQLLEEAGVPSPEVASAEEGRARAIRQLDEGLDGVKLFTGAILGRDGVKLMDAPVAAAVGRVARAPGKPVFAHPTTVRGMEIAIDGGANVLAHTTPADGPWSDGIVARLVRDDVAVVPTLAMFEIEIRREQAPPAVVERFVGNGQQQVAALAAAGGTVLFGTDAGYVEAFDTTRELQLLAATGLDWRQILASLTTAPAGFFGEGAQRGRIEPGAVADLVILGASPEQDATAFADVVHTLRGGKSIYSREAGAGPSR